MLNDSEKERLELYRRRVAQTRIPEVAPTPEPEPRNIARETFDELNMFEQGLVGAGRGLRETYLGAKDLVTDLSGAEQQELRTAESGIHGIPALVGEVVGEIGMMAVPGGAITKGAKYAPALAKTLAKMPKTAALAKDMALSVGIEGLKAPTDDMSRTDRMRNAALGVGVGAGLGKTLSKFGGVTPSKAAKAVEDLGVDKLTMGQRTTGLPRVAEGTMGGSVLSWEATRKAQQGSLQQWRDVTTKSIGDQVGIAVPTGRGSIKALRKGFNKRYDDVWAKNYDFEEDTFLTAVVNADNIAKTNLDDEAFKSMKELTGRLLGQMDRTKLPDGKMKGSALSDMHSLLKENVSKAYKDGDIIKAEALKDLQTTLVDSMPVDTRAGLHATDHAYRQYGAVREAADKAHKGEFTPTDVERILSRGQAGGAAEGREDFLTKNIENAVEVFDDIAVGKKPPTFERFANLVASIPLATANKIPGFRRIVEGNLPVQDKARLIAESLRNLGVTSGRVGGAAMGGDPQM